MKEVKWRWDMGCYIAFCPYCNEPAYFDEHCEFCGKEYKWKEGRHKPRQVYVGKYTIIQAPSRTVFAYDNDRGRLVWHSACTKRLSKRNLKKFAEAMIKEGATDERN